MDTESYLKKYKIIDSPLFINKSNKPFLYDLFFFQNELDLDKYAYLLKKYNIKNKEELLVDFYLNFRINFETINDYHKIIEIINNL